MTDKIRLIALDMDGTVVNSQGEVSNGNKDALLRALDAGIQVLIATGRIYGAAQLFRMQTGLALPMICANGAVIYDEGGGVLREDIIGGPTLQKLIRWAEEEDLYYHVFSGKTLLIRTEQGPAHPYLVKNEELRKDQRIDIRRPGLEGMLKAVENGANKMGIYSKDAQRLQAFRHRLQALETCEVTSSWANNIEVNPQGVDKGTALAWYCRKLGLTPRSAMAMGDNENDVPMLRTAFYSVAMGNASAPARQAARFITAHHDSDGVALAIRHLVFGEDVGDLALHARRAAGMDSAAQPV